MKSIVIRPNRSLSLDLSEIWNYRELFYIFAWRDIKVRYKQTLLGILWVIFQPITSTFIFTIFFGNLAKIPSGKLPYSLFVLSGLVFWNFFSTSLSHASDSMVANENIIKKVYFPKIILPLSSVVVSFVDFIINMIILIIYATILGYMPNIWSLVVFPIAILVSAVTASGLGLFLASFNVKYRDVRHILPFFIQILLFLTPVIYPASIAGKYSWILAINPMTGVIKAARSALLGGAPINWELLALSGITCFILLIFGVIYFKKTERYFADVV